MRELKLLANLNNSTQRIYPEVFDQKTDPKVREAEKNFESHPTTHCLMIIQKVSFSFRDTDNETFLAVFSNTQPQFRPNPRFGRSLQLIHPR